MPLAKTRLLCQALSADEPKRGTNRRGAKLFQWNICRRQRWSSVLFIDLFGFTAPRRSIITL
jgi:hypothetical protein